MRRRRTCSSSSTQASCAGSRFQRRGVTHDGRCRHRGRPPGPCDPRGQRHRAVAARPLVARAARRLPARAPPRADPPCGRAFPVLPGGARAGRGESKADRFADVAEARAHGAVRPHRHESTTASARARAVPRPRRRRRALSRRVPDLLDRGNDRRARRVRLLAAGLRPLGLGLHPVVREARDDSRDANRRGRSAELPPPLAAGDRGDAGGAERRADCLGHDAGRRAWWTRSTRTGPR